VLDMLAYRVGCFFGTRGKSDLSMIRVSTCPRVGRDVLHSALPLFMRQKLATKDKTNTINVFMGWTCLSLS